jgi:hypothetical protein
LSALPRLLLAALVLLVRLLAALVLLVGLLATLVLLVRLLAAALLLLARTRIVLLAWVLIRVGIVRIGHAHLLQGYRATPRPDKTTSRNEKSSRRHDLIGEDFAPISARLHRIQPVDLRRQSALFLANFYFL